MTELLLADLESIERQIDLIEKRARQGEEEAKQRFAVMEPVWKLCAKVPARTVEVSPGERGFFASSTC